MDNQQAPKLSSRPDPCLEPGREDRGRNDFSSKTHKAVRGAKNLDALGKLMDQAREEGGQAWDIARAALMYRAKESSLHLGWLRKAFAEGGMGEVPDAWSKEWMRSQFLENMVENAPEAFRTILEQWPDVVAWDIERADGRFFLLLKCGYKGDIASARALLERFPEAIQATINSTENPIGKLMFNGFLRQEDASWIKMLNEFDPGLVYRTSEDQQTSMIEMLAQYHRDKVLDELLEVAAGHDPAKRHGLGLIHFAAKGVKSTKMDKNSGRMRALEVDEIMEYGHGFVRVARVLARHGHDITAKVMKEHDSQGARPRGYPLAGAGVLSYFLKRNKAGSLPSEVLALLHSSIMGMTVRDAAVASAPSRGARF